MSSLDIIQPFFLIHSRHRGPDSRWYGYLQSLPDLVDLPVFWDSDALEWLKGTEAERLILGPGGTPLIVSSPLSSNLLELMIKAKVGPYMHIL